MTYDQLADVLAELAVRLRRHSSALTGAAPAKLARDLEKAAAKLTQLLDQAARHDSPEARRLADLIAEHSSALTGPRLADFAKRLGLKLPGAKTATALALRAKFAEAAMAGGTVPDAVVLLESFARVQAQPKPALDTEVARRVVLRQLGAQSAEEISFALEEHYSDEDLRDLARAAGLKVTAKAARKGLVTKLVPAMRRHAENTALDAGA